MTAQKRPMRLLNPGPVTLTERVRAALSRKDLCHREPEFAELIHPDASALLRPRTGLQDMTIELDAGAPVEAIAPAREAHA